MATRHRPDRRPEYPKTPRPGSETSPDEDRHRELDQHHPLDHPHPQPVHHPQKKTDLAPRHDAHSHLHGDELGYHTNPPGPIKPSKKITKTGSTKKI
jgi:hypothetical protein